MQNVILGGILEHWADTNFYTRFLFSSFRILVNHSTRSCRQLTIDSKQITTLLAIFIPRQHYPTTTFHTKENYKRNI